MGKMRWVTMTIFFCLWKESADACWLNENYDDSKSNLDETNGPRSSGIPDLPESLKTRESSEYLATMVPENINPGEQGTCQKKNQKKVRPEFDVLADGKEMSESSDTTPENLWEEVLSKKGCSSDIEEISLWEMQQFLRNTITVPVIQSEEEFVEFLVKGTLQLVVFFSSGKK